MKAAQFIDSRSKELAGIVCRFLHQQAEYNELHNYTWETLNAWQDYCNEDKQPGSERECVFWHLMYTLHLWDEKDLNNNRLVRLELSDCAAYLIGKGRKPQGCVGARP